MLYVNFKTRKGFLTFVNHEFESAKLAIETIETVLKLISDSMKFNCILILGFDGGN